MMKPQSLSEGMQRYVVVAVDLLGCPVRARFILMRYFAKKLAQGGVT